MKARSTPKFSIESLESRTLLSTYYVSPTGADTNAGSVAAPWKTLQRAADLVRAGDTVNVAAGDYAGFYKYGMKGTASAHISFRADPGVNIVTRNGDNNIASGIELSGYDSASGSAYVDLYGFNVNNASGTITGDVSSGVRLRFSNNIGLYNVNVSNIGYTGIYAAYVQNITLDGCSSVNNNGGNVATTWNNGVYIAQGSSGVTIRNCTVSGNNGAGIHINGDGGVNTGFLIENNIIHDNGMTHGGSSINCDGLQSSTIRNNLLYNVFGKGIALYQIDATDGSKNNTINNNTILMASSTGNTPLLLRAGATGNKVVNNVFMTQGSGPAIDFYMDSTADTQIDYNIYNTRLASDGSFQDLNAWRNEHPGFDSHSVNSAPGTVFANYTGSDFHLWASSPAIDKGVSVSGLISDIVGVLRPAGGAVDIGAYEYVGQASGSINVASGTYSFSGSRNVSSVSIAPGTRAIMSAGGNQFLRTQSLSIGSGGALDLNDNDLILDYSGANPFNQVRQWVTAGYSAVLNPAAAGIVSSAGQNANGKKILVVFDNAQVGMTQFDGQTIDSTTIVGKYTYMGDVNLDGKVTGDDYTILDANLKTSPTMGKGSLSGDVNLDGKVTGDDYTILDSTIGQSGSTSL